MDLQSTPELTPIQQLTWTPNIDAYFRTIADELMNKRKHCMKRVIFWKFVSMLSIPLGILSWIFGSAGFTSEAIQSNQSVVLLVVGACIVALERLKPKKYQQYYKTRAAGYDHIAKTILFEIQVHSITPQQLQHETLIKSRALNLSSPDSFDAANINENMDIVVNNNNQIVDLNNPIVNHNNPIVNHNNPIVTNDNVQIVMDATISKSNKESRKSSIQDIAEVIVVNGINSENFE